MDAFFVPLFTVALAEMGDRTQLMALILSARYGKPWPVLGGIVCATTANHLLAGVVGTLFGKYLTPLVVETLVGASLLVMSLWSLKPDTADENVTGAGRSAFLATFITFFLAEMGDKTQIATATLAAAYANLALVVIGSSLGLIVADLPVVFLGRAVMRYLPLRALRIGTAVLFAGLGLFFLVQAYARWSGAA